MRPFPQFLSKVILIFSWLCALDPPLPFHGIPPSWLLPSTAVLPARMYFTRLSGEKFINKEATGIQHGQREGVGRFSGQEDTKNLG